jgi:hypothetical protein
MKTTQLINYPLVLHHYLNQSRIIYKILIYLVNLSNHYLKKYLPLNNSILTTQVIRLHSVLNKHKNLKFSNLILIILLLWMIFHFHNHKLQKTSHHLDFLKLNNGHNSKQFLNNLLVNHHFQENQIHNHKSLNNNRILTMHLSKHKMHNLIVIHFKHKSIKIIPL